MHHHLNYRLQIAAGILNLETHQLSLLVAMSGDSQAPDSQDWSGAGWHGDGWAGEDGSDVHGGGEEVPAEDGVEVFHPFAYHIHSLKVNIVLRVYWKSISERCKCVYTHLYII